MVSNSLTDRLLGSPLGTSTRAVDSPMLIVCPSCATSYDVELQSLSPNGRQVRCARCRTVWRAEPSHADKLVLAAEAIAPGADDGVGEAAMATSDDAFENAAGGSLPSAASPDDTSLAPDSGRHDVATADPSEGDGYAPAIDAPPIAPHDFDRGRFGFDRDGAHADETTREVEDIESVAARRQPLRSRALSLRWPLSLVQTAILALALVDIVLIGWRSDVVRALPQTASFYSVLRLPVNLRNLTFNDVATSMEQHEGVPILVVEGNIYNTARKIEDVPRLKFIVRNAAHQEIYAWTAVPARATLGPGEGLGFRTRLASPPASAQDLVVRFLNRRDIVGGSR
jgi:predicted Zn finger-like uncharacterized protein